MKRKNNRGRRKADKKRRAKRARGNKHVEPRSLEQFLAMPGQDQDFWSDSVQIVTEVKTGTPFSKASRKFGRDPRKVLPLIRPALRKRRNGRWAAIAHDHLLRILPIPTRRGLRQIGVRDSRQATRIGKYWAAVERYLQTGDDSALFLRFRGKHIIDASGGKVRFLTDPNELDRLGSAGVLSFESLYARSA